MPATKRKNESWIAGLWEHRVALGVAATASILLMVLLAIQPGNQSGSKTRSAHDATHKQQAATPSQKNIGQATSGTPRYAIPEKSLPRQKIKKAAAPPVVKAVTPGTLAKPERIKRPAPKPAVKAPVATKPGVKSISKPSPVTPVAKAKPASGQTTRQDVKAAGRIFFVQVGAYSKRSGAQQHAATLLQKGWNSMVTSNAAGLYTVRVGPISSRGAAEKLRQQLLDKTKLKGFIVEG